MPRTIALGGQALRYRFRRSTRAHRVRVTVHAGGDVVLTAPLHVAPIVAERFLRQKSAWVLQKLSYFKRMGFVQAPALPRGSYRAHKERARLLVEARLAHFNQLYGFAYARISIRNQKTRWGSCSRSGTLSFNYRLALLPAHLADYVIVHELCHVARLDHSIVFWRLVARSCPDYKARRRELRSLSIP